MLKRYKTLAFIALIGTVFVGAISEAGPVTTCQAGAQYGKCQSVPNGQGVDIEAVDAVEGGGDFKPEVDILPKKDARGTVVGHYVYVPSVGEYVLVKKGEKMRIVRLPDNGKDGKPQTILCSKQRQTV